MRYLIVAFVLAFSLGCGGGGGRRSPEPTTLPAPPMPVAPKPAPVLILHDWFGTSPGCTPYYLKANLAHIDSLPVDGVAIYMRLPTLADNITISLMNPDPISYEKIAAVLAPVKGVAFQRLKHNFAAVISKTPPDFFDDAGWVVVAQNFANLARAAKDAGLKGVYIDNEQYFAKWGNHPDGIKDKTKSLAATKSAAFARGAQVMRAMGEAFPGVVVITLHGPYISEPTAPAPLFPQWQFANELLGPFFEGILSIAPPGNCVDGGELYTLRTLEDFRKSYDWRKGKWPAESVGFGVYDQRTTPEVLASTLRAALATTDRYVWLYVEGPTFLRPGPSDAFVAAVRAARP